MKYRNLKLKAHYVGKKPALFDAESAYRHHRIELTNTDNGKSIAFDYYPSKANPTVHKKEDYMSALGCFLNDASAGQMGDIDDFANEFGYTTSDTPVSKILEIWDGCYNAAIKLEWLFDGDIDDVQMLVNAVSEEGF